ncbi:MAG: hypothetical protein M3Q29_02160 [Chloroflexota bacterium]|nr:hypothetical protein [Chloroflexota bacterium]
MKLRIALLALLVALPLLYVTGAYLQNEGGATVGLALVAALCLWLIVPEGKRRL